MTVPTDTLQRPAADESARGLTLTRRLRRLRRSPAMRSLIRETRLTRDVLVYPLFVCPGRQVRRDVPSMPGVAQLSVDEAVREAEAGGFETFDSEAYEPEAGAR